MVFLANIFFEILNENIIEMKCTIPPIIAACIKSSNNFQLTPNAVSEGIVTIKAMIVPLRYMSFVENFELCLSSSN